MDRSSMMGSFSLPGYPLPKSTSEHVAKQAKLMNNNTSNANITAATNNKHPFTRQRSSVSFSDVSLSKRQSVTSLQRTVVSVNFDPDEMSKSTLKRSLDDKGFSRSTNLSALYGTMLVLLGLVVPMTEALRDDWLSNHIIAAFVTYLYVCASIFVVYSITHETILKRKHHREEMERTDVPQHDNPEAYTPNKDISDDCAFVNYAIDETEEPVAGTSDSDGHSTSSASTQPSNTDNNQGQIDGNSKVEFFVEKSNVETAEPVQKTLNPRRRFSSITSDFQDPDDVYNYFAMHMGTATLVDEGTSYFVKGGLLVFAMANIVYVALRIEGEHLRIRECGQEIIVYPHYFHMLFIVLQTFFLLKECRSVLRKHKPLVRFGLAHLIATNLCVWLRFLMMEVVESLDHSDDAEGHSMTTNTSDVNETECDVTPISSVAGHYLFPFVLEYSLVAMSICAFLFTSINIRVSRELYKAVCKALSQRKLSHRASDAPNDSSVTSVSAPEHHNFFSKSHSGLYMGVLVLAGTVISMILFFYYNGVEESMKANLCYTISETVSLILLLAMTVTGMVRFAKYVFDVNNSNGFDHALLLLSVSFYVVLELFEMFADVWYIMEGNSEPDNIMHLITCIVAIIQCTLQTVFILDGMQRVAVKDEHRRQKYGRGVITFLIIANVAAWVFASFLEKQADTVAPELFYGEVAWVIIESVALPLVLFYRFHSSICLAHMWHHCYEAHEDLIMDNKLLL